MKKIFLSLFTFLFILFPSFVFAQEKIPIDAEVNRGGKFFAYTCITDLVFKAVDASLIMAGIALFVFLVWGGIEYMTSGGDKAKTETAQKRITSAIIGVAIIASSFAIWKTALYFFGINDPSFCDKKEYIQNTPSQPLNRINNQPLEY